MPRARLPNARCLASTDSPLLPFLAPRAFTESPYRQRNSHRHAGATPKEQEKETHSDTKDRITIAGPELSSSLRASSLPVNGLRQPTVRRCQDQRYADIFCFARQQLRSYRTRNLRTSTAMAAEVVKSYGSTRQLVDNSTRVAVGNPLNTQALLDVRRKKALHQHQDRMNTMLSYESAKKKIVLLMQGRYRSLRRRLFLFSRNGSTKVDLTEHKSGPRSEHLLIRAFAVLDRQVYPGARRKTHQLHMVHSARCGWYVTKQLFKYAAPEDEDVIWRNWTGFEKATRDTYWPYLLLYTLDRKPSHALSFLRVLCRQPRPQSLSAEMIADAMGHLARVHLTKDSEALSWSKNHLVPTFFYVFRDFLSQHKKVCSQDLLMNIARLAAPTELKRVFDILLESKTYFVPDTLLHYANAFAEAGEHEYALRCLIAITERCVSPLAKQAIVDRDRFRWTCALILRKSMSVGRNYHETTNIVAVFVKLGVKLNILLYNVIMHNAMEAGDYSTAFRVYNTLEENGLKPDERTLSILLYGCTMATDPVKFHDFAEYCAQAAVELRAPWLAADYIYYLYVRHCQDEENVRHAVATIRAAYLRFFSPAVLEPFWTRYEMTQRESTRQSVADGFTPMEPPPIALYVMLQMEIRNALDVSNNRVRDLYKKFRSLTRTHYHPVLDKLARNPVVWNAFLFAFCRKQQFKSASALIKSMTEHSLQPNIYSWNIFMQAFFKTGQVQAAERVFEIMRARGVEPDQFTYGVLLRGYARAQHLAKIEETLGYVENEEQLDPMLLRALARVHDRKRLVVALEKSRVRKEQKEMVEAHDEAAKQSARWRSGTSSPLIELNAHTSEKPVEADTATCPHSPSVVNSSSLPSSERTQEVCSEATPMTLQGDSLEVVDCEKERPEDITLAEYSPSPEASPEVHKDLQGHVKIRKHISSSKVRKYNSPMKGTSSASACLRRKVTHWRVSLPNRRRVIRTRGVTGGGSSDVDKVC